MWGARTDGGTEEKKELLYFQLRLLNTLGVLGDINTLDLASTFSAGVWSLAVGFGVPVNPAFCCLHSG